MPRFTAEEHTTLNLWINIWDGNDINKKLELKSEIVASGSTDKTVQTSGRGKYFKWAKNYLLIQLDNQFLHWAASTENLHEYKNRMEQLLGTLTGLDDSSLRNFVRKTVKYLPSMLRAHDCLFLPFTSQQNFVINSAFMDIWFGHLETIPPKEALEQNKNKKTKRKNKVLGLLSPDVYRDHPLCQLVLPIFANFNQQKWDIVLFNSFDVRKKSYAYEEEDISFHELVKSSMQVVHVYEDIRAYRNTDEDESKKRALESMTKKIKEVGCDVFLDLTGIHTGFTFEYIIIIKRFELGEIVGCHGLGFAGTSGCKNVDVYFSDEVVIPPDESKFYSERIAYVPGSYFSGGYRDFFPFLFHRMDLTHESNGLKLSGEAPEDMVCISGLQFINGDEDNINTLFGVGAQTGGSRPKSTSIIVTTRLQLQLPENVPIIGIFNSMRKLSPEVWKCCTNILKRKKDVHLWYFIDNDDVSGGTQLENLKKQLQIEGINVKRLIRAELATKEFHLRRIQFVTVFLDCFPCNSHTTAIDYCLSGGLLVTASIGKSLAARVGQSILQSIRMNALIAKDYDEMENICLQIIVDENWRQTLKKAMKRRVESSPTFCPALTAYFLERLLEKILKVLEDAKASTSGAEPTDDLLKFRAMPAGDPIRLNKSELKRYNDIMAYISNDDCCFARPPLTYVETVLSQQSALETSTEESDDENMDIVESDDNTPAADEEQSFFVPIITSTAMKEHADAILNAHAHNMGQKVYNLQILTCVLEDILYAMNKNLQEQCNEFYPAGPLLVNTFTECFRERLATLRIPRLPTDRGELTSFFQRYPQRFTRPEQYLQLLVYFRPNKADDGTAAPQISIHEEFDAHWEAMNKLCKCIIWDAKAETVEYYYPYVDTKRKLDAFMRESFNGCPFCTANSSVIEPIKSIKKLLLHYKHFHREHTTENKTCRFCGKHFAKIDDRTAHENSAHLHQQSIFLSETFKDIEIDMRHDISQSNLDKWEYEVNIFGNAIEEYQKYAKKKWYYNLGQKQLTFCWLEKSIKLVMEHMTKTIHSIPNAETIFFDFLWLVSVHLDSQTMPYMPKMPASLDEDFTAKDNRSALSFTFLDAAQTRKFMSIFKKWYVEASSFGKGIQTTQNLCPCFGNPHSLSEHFIDKTEAEKCGLCGFLYPPRGFNTVNLKNHHKCVHQVYELRLDGIMR